MGQFPPGSQAAGALPQLQGETWYHLFQVVRQDADLPVPTMENLPDFGFSTDPKGQDLPGDVRRVGSVLTDAAGEVVPFHVEGDWFNFTQKV